MSAALAALTRFMPLRSWGILAAGLALFAALWLAVLAWGAGRYREGVADNDAKWRTASARLEAQARKAGTRADEREADRIEDHAAQVAREKEKIDAATASGASPLDALFGGV